MTSTPVNVIAKKEPVVLDVTRALMGSCEFLLSGVDVSSNKTLHSILINFQNAMNVSLL